MFLALLAMLTPNYLPVTCGNPYVEYTVGAQNTDGTFSGRLYESTSCSSGGRGSKPHRYATCQAVIWDANGYVLSHSLIWTDTGLTVRGAGECFQ